MRTGLVIAISLVMAAIVALVVSLLTPPSTVRIATGIKDGGYWQVGRKYNRLLKRDDIYVQSIETKGSIENIEKLIAGEVDVAIVQGGLEIDQDNGLQSLGAVFLEPIAVFRNTSFPLDPNPGEWSGVRLAAGPEGSGTRAAAQALIDAAGLEEAGIVLVPAGGSEALVALREGRADAMLIVAPLSAPYFTEAVFDPSLEFVPMSLVEALALRLPDARSSIVPAGALTLDPPRPAEEVKYLALTASLIARSDLHPALVNRIVTAARKLHGTRDILHGSREFPSTDSPPVPMNEQASQLIDSGPNMLHDFLPYWIAAQFGRFLLIVLPILFIAPPLLRAIPAAYIWFQKRRIWNHYHSISEIENSLADSQTIEDIEAISRNLDEVKDSLANLKVPLAYRQAAYDARLHIDMIRQEIKQRLD